MTEDEEFELLMDADPLKENPEVSFWASSSAPMAFPSEDENGVKGSVIFPYGVQAFAERLNADLVSIEGVDVHYFSDGQWKTLGGEERKPSSVTNLRGNKPSTPEGPRKPNE